MPPTSIPGSRINGEVVEMPLESIIWRPTAYAVIVNVDQELLLMDNLWTGKLFLPGGGIEIWESMPEALVREVWEETGLNVQVTNLIHAEDAFLVTPSGKHWHIIRLYFRAIVIDGALRSTILPDEPTVNPHWRTLRTCTPDLFTVGWDAIQKVRHHELGTD